MSTTSPTSRPPVVAVMGHIDHGKSTLLDYIRSTQVVASEAGGITQSISAYEVEREHEGIQKKITFLDTPGHEAFQEMRSRGSSVADIAILMVSAEDGVKPQTLEALKAIQDTHTPYIVAINKIDRPNADVERTKSNLMEHGIYLEGLGGDVPYVPISAKKGDGVSDLLDVVHLLADMQELTTDSTVSAEGIVIEAHRDPKVGVSATLIIKNGALKTGSYVVAGNACAPVRAIEDCHGHKIIEAVASTPVRIAGFSGVPASGTPFVQVASKKDAEAKSAENEQREKQTIVIGDEATALVTIPVLIKVDAFGTLDAIVHELKKLEHERIALKLIAADVGAISEGDIKSACAFNNALVAGFNVSVDASARDLAERFNIDIGVFSIIYELAEWLSGEVQKRIPKQTTEQVVGRAKILKVFSVVKDKQVAGGRVLEGTITLKHPLSIIRNGEAIGRGKIKTLQQSKVDTLSVSLDQEFGMQIESPTLLSAGDEIHSFDMIES